MIHMSYGVTIVLKFQHIEIYIAYLFIYRQLRRRGDITFCLHTVLKYRGHNLWFTNSLDNKSKVMPPQEEFKLWSSQVTYVKTNYLCILQNTWWLQSETDLIWSMSTYCVEFDIILYHSPPKISHLQHICSLYCSGFLEKSCPQQYFYHSVDIWHITRLIKTNPKYLCETL